MSVAFPCFSSPPALPKASTSWGNAFAPLRKDKHLRKPVSGVKALELCTPPTDCGRRALLFFSLGSPSLQSWRIVLRHAGWNYTASQSLNRRKKNSQKIIHKKKKSAKRHEGENHLPTQPMKKRRSQAVIVWMKTAPEAPLLQCVVPR